MGYAIALIGSPGEGKSRFATETLKKNSKRNALAYDIYGYEYGEKYGVNLSLDTTQNRCRYVGTGLPAKERYKNFVELARGRKNCDIVFEDATGYMEGRMAGDIVGMVIDKRHTGNNYFFLFHAIEVIPPRLLLHLDFIYLFKTLDTKKDVMNKAERLLPAWQQLQGKPPGSGGILINWKGTKVSADA